MLLLEISHLGEAEWKQEVCGGDKIAVFKLYTNIYFVFYYIYIATKSKNGNCKKNI